MRYFLTHPLMARQSWGYVPMGFNGGRRLPLDVRADGEAYVITAAVPGLEPDKLEIEVLDDVVTLRTKGEAEEDSREYLMREMWDGEAERSLRLPGPVDAAKAEAKVENGLLTLRLPIAEDAKPKTIKIKAG